MAHLCVGLLGYPNAGKTSLFKVLTGRRQATGNWSGVTIDVCQGYYQIGDLRFELFDLPGFGQWGGTTADNHSTDKRITEYFLASQKADVLVNVVDVTRLAQQLKLTQQILAEATVPVIVVLNKTDVLAQQGVALSPENLSTILGCPVVSVSVHKGQGFLDLQQALGQVATFREAARSEVSATLPRLAADVLGLDQKLGSVPEGFKTITALVGKTAANLSNLSSLTNLAKLSGLTKLTNLKETLLSNFLADLPFSKHHQTRTERWDKWVLHPVIGIPIFLSVMLGLFIFSMGLGGLFQEFFDTLSNAWFIEAPMRGLEAMAAPVWLKAMVTGLGQGVTTTLSFVPVLMGLFMGLHLLEQSGYIARAARIAAGLTHWIRLPGKAFIPLLVGFGCNVPAVMGTRILKHARDRIVTILMLPFMSCGARLTIYAIFVSAFFAESGYRVLFMLYLIGVLAALFTARVFQGAFFGKKSGQAASLAEEEVDLPDYQWPSLTAAFRQAYHRAKRFVAKAGFLIIPFCVVMATIGHITPGAPLGLDVVGKGLTPIFEPMGVKEDNWPATVGLLAGVLAKEVVIGSLDTLYSQMGEEKTAVHKDGLVPALWTSQSQALQYACVSVWRNVVHLFERCVHPVTWGMEASDSKMSHSTQKIMVKQFGSEIAALAYLVFVLLYFPCISVVAAIAKELNIYWAALSVAWSSGLAYAISVIIYQGHQWINHGSQHAASWVVAMLTLLGSMVLGIYGVGRYTNLREAACGRGQFKGIAVRVVV